MRPEFSEFQFAMAVIHEFLETHKNSIMITPSQIKEKELGYDVALMSSKGIPIFYQFKTSQSIGKRGKYFNI